MITPAYTIRSGGLLENGIEKVSGSIRCLSPEFEWRIASIGAEGIDSVFGDGKITGSVGEKALILLEDQSAEFGSWHIRNAAPEARWDEMLEAESIANALDRILRQEAIRSRYPHGSPVGWSEIGRGSEGLSEGFRRLKVSVLGMLDRGASFEIRRRGSLKGSPSVLRVSCDEAGVVSVSGPRAEAISRAAKRNERKEG